MRILIIEDQELLGSEIEKLLKEKGNVCLRAKNLIMADKFLGGTTLDHKAFDVIIIDFNLPVKGLTPEEIEKTDMGMFTGLVWHDKNSSKLRNTKVIFLSGYFEEFAERRESRYQELESNKDVELVKKGNESINEIFTFLGLEKDA